MTGDARTHAALAVEQALCEADRQRILDRFRHGNLNGADVADILDILDNHDALLDLREPFYEGDGADEVRRRLDWPITDAEDYPTFLQHRLIGYSCLAVALLTDAVPTSGPVARLAGAANDVAAKRWPEGRYIREVCTCSTWWFDPYTGREYDQGGGDRERRYSFDPECPVHGQETR